MPIHIFECPFIYLATGPGKTGLTCGHGTPRKLCDRSNAPSARLAHPDEDHLISLMVAVGAAEAETGARVYHEDSFFGGVAVSSYRFGK